MRKVIALLFAASLSFAACQSGENSGEATTTDTTATTAPEMEEPTAPVEGDTTASAPLEGDTAGTVTQ